MYCTVVLYSLYKINAYFLGMKIILITLFNIYRMLNNNRSPVHSKLNMINHTEKVKIPKCIPLPVLWHLCLQDQDSMFSQIALKKVE